MGVGQRVCKTCGKTYIACHTPNPNGTFRWRDVACSIECAAEYLEKVRAARAAAEEDAAEEKE